VRLLLDGRDPNSVGLHAEDLSDEDLAGLYAYPHGPTVRTNAVTTLDGSAVGPDRASGSIGTAADRRVFEVQRRLCDAVLVGAGTARTEGYRLPLPGPDRPEPPVLVVVSASAAPPPALTDPREEGGGRGLLVTCAAAGEAAIAAARAAVGRHEVWVVGEDEVDLRLVLDRLGAAGMPHVLAEGGPTLLGTLLDRGLVDEVALTLAPRIVGGDGTRVTHGPFVDLDLAPTVLLEEEGTLLGLWRVRR